jgi:hypothetical protein
MMEIELSQNMNFQIDDVGFMHCRAWDGLSG